MKSRRRSWAVYLLACVAVGMLLLLDDVRPGNVHGQEAGGVWEKQGEKPKQLMLKGWWLEKVGHNSYLATPTFNDHANNMFVKFEYQIEMVVGEGVNQTQKVVYPVAENPEEWVTVVPDKDTCEVGRINDQSWDCKIKVSTDGQGGDYQPWPITGTAKYYLSMRGMNNWSVVAILPGGSAQQITASLERWSNKTPLPKDVLPTFVTVGGEDVSRKADGSFTVRMDFDRSIDAVYKVIVLTVTSPDPSRSEEVLLEKRLVLSEIPAPLRRENSNAVAYINNVINDVDQSGKNLNADKVEVLDPFQSYVLEISLVDADGQENANTTWQVVVPPHRHNIAHLFVGTPAAFTYEHDLLRRAWGICFAIMGLLLVVILVWLGLYMIWQHHLGESKVTWRELVPRLLLGTIAAGSSFLVCSMILDIADAVSGYVLVTMGVSPGSLVRVSLTKLVETLHGAGPAHAGMVVFVYVAYVIFAVMLLIQMLIRVGVINLLVAVAPLAFGLWILPQTAGWGRHWLRLFLTVVFQQALQLLCIGLGLGYLDQYANLEEANGHGEIVWGLVLSAVFVYVATKVPSMMGTGNTFETFMQTLYFGTSLMRTAMNPSGFGVMAGLATGTGAAGWLGAVGGLAGGRALLGSETARGAVGGGLASVAGGGASLATGIASGIGGVGSRIAGRGSDRDSGEASA